MPNYQCAGCGKVIKVTEGSGTIYTCCDDCNRTSFRSAVYDQENVKVIPDIVKSSEQKEEIKDVDQSSSLPSIAVSPSIASEPASVDGGSSPEPSRASGV